MSTSKRLLALFKLVISETDVPSVVIRLLNCVPWLVRAVHLGIAADKTLLRLNRAILAKLGNDNLFKSALLSSYLFLLLLV